MRSCQLLWRKKLYTISRLLIRPYLCHTRMCCQRPYYFNNNTMTNAKKLATNALSGLTELSETSKSVSQANVAHLYERSVEELKSIAHESLFDSLDTKGITIEAFKEAAISQILFDSDSFVEDFVTSVVMGATAEITTQVLQIATLKVLIQSDKFIALYINYLISMSGAQGNLAWDEAKREEVIKDLLNIAFANNLEISYALLMIAKKCAKEGINKEERGYIDLKPRSSRISK